MINILGASGSGKSTLETTLVEKGGFRRIIAFTTRSKRHYEVNGNHYNFVSDHEFNQKDLILKRVSGKFQYGIDAGSIDQTDGDITLGTFDINGIKELVRRGIDVKVVYLDVPDEIRRQRMINRGDDISIVNFKIEDDRGKFDLGSLNLEVVEFNMLSVIESVERVMKFIHNK